VVTADSFAGGRVAARVRCVTQNLGLCERMKNSLLVVIESTFSGVRSCEIEVRRARNSKRRGCAAEGVLLKIPSGAARKPISKFKRHGTQYVSFLPNCNPRA